jgi:peroxiredoxin Q/BCP
MWRVLKNVISTPLECLIPERGDRSMTTLRSGSIAPEFSLKDKDGTTHSLKQVKSKYTVVFFYPKDDTPGCTIEAKEISAALSKFAAAGVTVFGVSGGDDKSKRKFCEKYDLNVTLLSDTDFSVAAAYGCYGEKTFMGRTFMGIYRSTFLLDGSKRIVKVFDGVKPEGHSAELLAAVATLSKGGSLSDDEVVEPKKKGGKKKSTGAPLKKKAVAKKTASKAVKKSQSKGSKKSTTKAVKKVNKKATQKASPVKKKK